MRLLVDPFSGLAGDMFVGALLDLGADPEAMDRALKALPLEGYRVEVDQTQRAGIAATWFRVVSTAAPSSHNHHHEPTFPGQPSRDHATIQALLQTAALEDGVRDRAQRIFRCLGEAEAAVHGTTIDEVHFHEVGAVDAIVDITATAALLNDLGIDEILVGPIALGGGQVHAAHGTMPVPAPATAKLLQGFVVRAGNEADGELTTPTGAAIVAALATPRPQAPYVMGKSGFGAGSRNPKNRANVLRLICGDDEPATQVMVLETNMDDIRGEQVPVLIDHLLGAGALDVIVAPVLMKKGRSGFWVQALCPLAHQAQVSEAMLRHGSTFGVRFHQATRTMLQRHFETVTTQYGQIRVKVGRLKDEVLHQSPEFEDVRLASEAAGVPLQTVYRAALLAMGAT